MHTGVLWGELKERGHLKKLDVNGIIIITCILKIYSESYGPIIRPRGSNKRQAVVKTVMKLRVQINEGNSLSSLWTISFSRRILLHAVWCCASCYVSSLT